MLVGFRFLDPWVSSVFDIVLFSLSSWLTDGFIQNIYIYIYNICGQVADVKKNIETVLGVIAAEQVLIHKGKVLKDETTVEANNVSEKSTIGVMKVCLGFGKW